MYLVNKVSWLLWKTLHANSYNLKFSTFFRDLVNLQTTTDLETWTLAFCLSLQIKMCWWLLNGKTNDMSTLSIILPFLWDGTDGRQRKKKQHTLLSLPRMKREPIICKTKDCNQPKGHPSINKWIQVKGKQMYSNLFTHCNCMYRGSDIVADADNIHSVKSATEHYVVSVTQMCACVLCIYVFC